MTTLKLLKENIGSDLGRPSKMPGYSWGISADLCITGGTLINLKGSVCHGCYALKGNYRYPSVTKSHANRIAAYNKDNIIWRDGMVELLRKRIPVDAPIVDKYFRIFDAGDIQSEQMLIDWIFVAEQLPDIKFWLPTKEYRIIRKFKGEIPDNLIIRVSSPNLNQEPLKFTHTSTVHEESSFGFECKAYTRDHKCGSCRACWDKEIPNVSYPEQ